MSYYYNAILENIEFDAAIEKVTAALKEQGFGILTEIDVQATLKKKIDVDFRKYKILGACNPGFAHKALSAEGKIGVFLPCNVVVEENEKGQIEVFAVSPQASMMSVKNDSLIGIAGEVESRLKSVIEGL